MVVMNLVRLRLKIICPKKSITLENKTAISLCQLKLSPNDVFVLELGQSFYPSIKNVMSKLAQELFHVVRRHMLKEQLLQKW